MAKGQGMPEIPRSGVNMPCPWCHYKDKHPKGSPPCDKDRFNLVGPRVINLGAVFYWLTMVVTEVATKLPAFLDHVRLLERKIDVLERRIDGEEVDDEDEDVVQSE